jgi:hypothetical protein
MMRPSFTTVAMHTLRKAIMTRQSRTLALRLDPDNAEYKEKLEEARQALGR